jgi:transcriptional regulator with XRE-family HTH domain
MNFHPVQSRAARALLEWSQGRLAEAAGLGLSTVRDFEKGRKTPLPKNLEAIMLGTAGVQFINGSDGGPGVRLKLDGP